MKEATLEGFTGRLVSAQDGADLDIPSSDPVFAPTCSGSGPGGL